MPRAAWCSRATALCAAARSNDPVVRRVADEVDRTPAQVLVRWHVQHGIVVIPRSSKPDRVRANADVGGFALSAEQMSALDALGRG